MKKSVKISVLLLILIPVAFYLLFLDNPITGNAVSNKNTNFTVVVLPDTQYYSEKYPETFTRQTQWIIDNKDKLNIVMVLHLGDIVQTPEVEEEWQRANESMSLLDDAKIPYLVTPGNHDLNSTFYEKYFGVDRFKNYEWYKGNFPEGSNENSYALLNINGDKLGFISVKYFDVSASAKLTNETTIKEEIKIIKSELYNELEKKFNSTINWTSNVLNEFDDYKFIFITHIYSTGTKECLSEEGWILWEKLISNTSNIEMIFSGHDEGYTENVCISKTDKGTEIIEILSNFQTEINGGDGKLRYYTFVPEKDKQKENLFDIYTYTYNTNQNLYIEDEASQFVIDDLFYIK